MFSKPLRLLLLIWLAIVGIGSGEATGAPADSKNRAVLESISRARAFLLRSQQTDGSWNVTVRKESQEIAFTSFVLLALLHSGMSPEDEAVARGLDWLRAPERTPRWTHEIALMIEAFAAAKDGKQDVERVGSLVNRLMTNQVRGANDGSWSFGGGGSDGDSRTSNAHFAALALREAQELGVNIDPDVWQDVRDHWVGRQNPDGGWGAGRSSGGITAAGIAYVHVTSASLREGLPDLGPGGDPICCGAPPRDEVVDRACRWLGSHFAVGHNPRRGETGWFYYLYGLERVGRLTGRRFFTNARGEQHDWYREGCDVLVARQDRLTGAWTGAPEALEDEPVLATSYALMFLSRGLSPVVVNKLRLGVGPTAADTTEAEDSNRHPDDVKNLVQFITTRERWPRHLNWQTIELPNAEAGDLLQAPIAFLHGTEAPLLNERELSALRDYLQRGGFLLAVRGCNSAAFDEGFRDLVRRLELSSETSLRPLDSGHPVYRSEYPLLDPDTGRPIVELWGADAGCRTCIVYVPEDLSCLWEKWTSYARPRRSPELTASIERAMRVGVNVVAYVTGREPVNKLVQGELAAPIAPDSMTERDVLRIARVQHAGDWNAAPDAMRNLMTALRTTAGVPAASAPGTVLLTDRALFQYPLIALHGRSRFELTDVEKRQLRKYVEQGGVLFADACCSSAAFDGSFRKLMKDLFPGEALTDISPRHELYSKRIAFDLSRVQLRTPPGVDALEEQIESSEPQLEGVQIDGKLVVIYSRHDLSCALSHPTPGSCPGYTRESAIQLGVNIVLYALRE